MTFSCKRAAHLVSDSMDSNLSLRSRFSLRLHLLVCGMCRTYRRQLAILRRLLRDEVRSADSTNDAGRTRLSLEARQRIGRALGISERTGGGLDGAGNSP